MASHAGLFYYTPSATFFGEIPVDAGDEVDPSAL
jgi:hypothetical protein